MVIFKAAILAGGCIVEIVLNMFVALCVGISYVVGYLLAALSFIFLITWIIDDKYKTNFSNNIFDFLKLFFLEKNEKVICQRCEDAKDIDLDAIEDNYCYLCGKEFKKSKASAYDIKVEKLTNKILLFALTAILLYTISTTLLVVFLIISTLSYYFFIYRDQPNQK
ncbi:MAG: hypothetical protein V2J13_11040 [Cycloclasticus sp.]|jgi:hypothetical protein|nr:hypothetical protein [Cycloclasticus sp.]